MDDTTQPNPRADQLLVLRCQLGERDAFDALIRRWAAPLHRYAMKLAPDRDIADELVQEVWLRVLKGLPRLREPDRFQSWVFGIAHRVFADRLRIRYAMPTEQHLDLDALPADAADVDRHVIALAVQSGIEQLPIVEREVLTLFYLEELSLADIATALDVPVGTVKSRLFRARTLLRPHLTNKDLLP